MNVAMMQPTFIPWQGYFELIYKSEVFVFLDDFQFSVQSYHQRNRLFVNKGQVGWYSVPVQKSVSFKFPLNQTKITETVLWRTKMWKRIQQNYSKAPYYSECAPFIEKWLFSWADSLAAKNISFIKLVCNLLGFQRKFRLSSQFLTEVRRSERVVELLQWCNADHYYCAKGSFDYMLEDGIFPIDNIVVLFQDFYPKSYKQVGAKDSFVPYLSVLDALMNVGPGQTAELIANGTRQWLTWEAMFLERSLSPDNKEASKENYQ